MTEGVILSKFGWHLLSLKVSILVKEGRKEFL